MAKYYITAACGCEVVEQIYGKHFEREKRIAFIESRDCPECWKRKQLEAAQSKSTGLPELQGSEKQISWAMTIRAGKIESLNLLLSLIDEHKQENHEKQREFVLSVINNNSAKFWIDNRMKNFDREWFSKNWYNNTAPLLPEEPKQAWKKFAVNIQNIKRETEKAVLIAMPHKSNYDGYEFWFPKKLVRQGSHSYERSLLITDDMEIKLQRISEKTWKVLDEKTVNADEMVSIFGEFKGYTTTVKEELKPEIVTHTPERLEPEKREADATLIR